MKEVTGAEAGLAGDEQIPIALIEIIRLGDVVQISRFHSSAPPWKDEDVHDRVSGGIAPRAGGGLEKGPPW